MITPPGQAQLFKLAQVRQLGIETGAKSFGMDHAAEKSPLHSVSKLRRWGMEMPS